MASDLRLNDDPFFDYGATLLAALAHRNRLVILRILMRGEMPVVALAQLMGVAQSTLAQHLGKLHVAGLVVRRRHGKVVYYSCNSEAVAQVMQALGEIWPDSQIKRTPARVSRTA